MKPFMVKEEAGYRLQVRPVLRGHRLEEVCLATGRTERFWCFTTPAAAILAARAWEVSGETEPAGWAWRGGARPRRG